MKVGDRVIGMIENLFERKEFGVVYICEGGDRKEGMGNGVFDCWFGYGNEKEEYVIMVGNMEELEGVDNQGGMIVRKDNGDFVDQV